MAGPFSLAVDTLGGDCGLRVTLPASLQVLQAHPELHLCLVGDTDAMQAQLGDPGALRARLSFEHAPDNIPMDMTPSRLLREQDQTSMRRALAMLAEGQVAGVVSAGHSGALMALGRSQLNMLHGFSRPAICSALPGVGHSYLLDLGANVECSSFQLMEFAHMGAALVRALHEIQQPTVALLSNGAELGKGTDAVREAAALLQELDGIDFVGYVEADQLLHAPAQVIVCDGFSGNIALKAMEGTARFTAQSLRDAYNSSLISRAAGWLSRAPLKRFAASVNPDRHGGAFLLGLDGVVVKSHGASTEAGFAAAVAQAAACIEHDMVPRMARSLANPN